MSHVKPDDGYNNNVHDREKDEKKVNQNLISCEKALCLSYCINSMDNVRF